MIKLTELKTKIKENAADIKADKKLLRQDHRELPKSHMIQYKLHNKRCHSRTQHLVYAWLLGKRFDQVESNTVVNDHFRNVTQYIIRYHAKNIIQDQEALEIFLQWIRDTSVEQKQKELMVS